MIGTLVIKEIHENILNIRFLVVSLLCIILVPAGMFVGLMDYEFRLEDYNMQVNSYIERNRGNVDRDFVGEMYRSPSPLSIFSEGLGNSLPYMAVIRKDEDPDIRSGSTIDNPLTSLFGKIDFSFIVSYILSILAFVFTFQSISGEKENGTLRLMISNSIPRWKILLAKVLGNYLVFIFPVIISMMIGLMIVSISASFPFFTKEILVPVLLILLAIMVFLFVLFNLGILFSTITRNSATSLIMLLFIWVLISLVIPKLSPMAAQIIYPVESKQTLNTEIKMTTHAIQEELIAREKEIGDEVFGGRMSVSGEEGVKKQADYSRLAVPLREEYRMRIASEVSRLRSDYMNRRNAQTSISVNLARLSPASSMSFVLAELSGTGSLEEESFRTHVARFDEQVRNEVYYYFITSNYYSSSGWGFSFSMRENAPDEFPVPQYPDYRNPGLSEILASVWIDIMALCLYALAFFVASFLAFMRYDVR